MRGDTGREGSGRDELATLIRLAGQRPPVPEERVARAREVAHGVWRREIRRLSSARLLWGAAALATAASLIVVLSSWLTSRGSAPVAGVGGMGPIEIVAGAAQIREQAAGRLAPSRALVGKTAVPPGSILITSGAQRAAILLPSGHSLRLDLATQVRIEDAETLQIDRGALYVASATVTRADRPLRVETPLGLVREMGTQFEIRLEGGAVRVRVREGSVVLEREDTSREAAAGTEMSLGADGSIAAREISLHGADWDWIGGVTPMPALDGRTARMFLDWVAREQGWRLVFTDASVEESAGSTQVAGDLEGMTISQALDAVLPSCGLDYTIENGVLKVGTSP